MQGPSQNRTSGSRPSVWAVGAILLAGFACDGEVIAGASAQTGRQPETRVWELPFEFPRPDESYGLDVAAMLAAGSAKLTVLDPEGNAIHEHLWGTRLSKERVALGPELAPGAYRVSVTLDGALGRWHVGIVRLPPPSRLWAMQTAGPLVLLLGLACAIGWKVAARVQWRWFAAGALILVAVALLRFAGLVAAELTVRGNIEDRVSPAVFIALDSLYFGALGGVIACALTWFAARIFPVLRERAATAAALGVGAGSLEALASGAGTALGMVTVLGTGPRAANAQFDLAFDMGVTPLLPLVDAGRHACLIVTRVAVAVLVVHGVAGRHKTSILAGILLSSVVEASIGASRLFPLYGWPSRWNAVLVAVPWAAISVVLARPRFRHWPVASAAGESPMEAFLRREGAEPSQAGP